MSSWHLGHPEEGLLLRYLDGELAAWKARQVRRHVEACWQCRTDLESLATTVADCMRYRKQVLAAHLPEPPNPWADLRRGFEQVDASWEAEPLWKRLAWVPRSWQWGTVAVAAAVLLTIFVQLRETPAVQAAALLRKAVTAAGTRPVRVHRIMFRTKLAQATRTVGVSGAAYSSLPPAMDGLFGTAHYDAKDPLSARAFQTWHDSVPDKKDEVTTVANPQAPSDNCYQIRTLAAAGEVSAATLTLRIADLEPVEGKLEFRDRSWIEFSEVSESPTQDDGSLAANSMETLVRPAEPSRPAAVAPRSMASISDELQVLSALHQIGADLGDPVEVKRVDGRVLVSGIGIAPQRQRQIHAVLDEMPNVSVEFSKPEAVPAAAETGAPGTVSGTVGTLRIQTRLEQQLGGRAELERFTSRMLDWDEAAMSHAYALRSLAERFPAGAELSANDRAVLLGMAREHMTALSTHAGGIQKALAPVLTGLGGSLASATQRKAPAAAWQPAVTDLFRSARRVEVLLSELLGAASGTEPPADLPSQLLVAMGDLRSDLDQGERLLAQ